MAIKITCCTLFDITQTGVLNRFKAENESDVNNWIYQRNTQCNFDTILQVISLRSQPEEITKPKKYQLYDFDKFGTFIEKPNKDISYWKFTFEINYKGVFDNGINELGYLYADCDKVPMIICGTEYKKLSNCLDISPEYKNIFFEIQDE